jgi:rare lipoprotein A
LIRALLALLILCGSAQAQEGSCYGYESSRQTASGERFNPDAMTAAHKTLPFGTLVRVTYAGRSVVVRITDRGPFIKGRVIDLSIGACRKIGLDKPGHAPVQMEIIK